MEKLPVLYIFVRTDLPSMTPGKAQAHSGHAANAFIHKHVVKPLQNNQEPIPAVNAWISQTEYGFGTQINLKGDWNDVVNSLAKYCEAGGLGELVVDPTYPYIIDAEIVNLIDRNVHTVEPKELNDGRWLCHRNEATAIYLFGYKDEMDHFIGQYSLHP